jgi:hypothetical protein
VIHDPHIIRIYKVIIPINEYMYIKINLRIQQTPIYFGQTCGQLQGYKIQSLDTLKSESEIIKAIRIMPWV